MNELIEYEKRRHQARKRGRVLREMKIDEISSVDRPAQRGAVAVILKRDDAMGSPQDFEDAVDRIAKRDPTLSRSDAWSRAARVWPELREQYEADGIAAQAMHEQIAKADLAKRNTPEVQRFDQLCDQIQKRDQCSRFQAYQRAAREMPTEDFAKFSRVVADE